MSTEKTRYSILHLICGLPGSGKTSLAKNIESSQNAIRFCPDEWIKDIWTSENEATHFRNTSLQDQATKNLNKGCKYFANCIDLGYLKIQIE